jgi:hypothetical protein
MIDVVPVWSTKRKGDPASVGHRMEDDGYGRPSGPACGVSSQGLFFRAWLTWDDVPIPQRCPECGLRVGGTPAPTSSRGPGRRFLTDASGHCVAGRVPRLAQDFRG